MAIDYKSTVFLPKTEFEMRGKLPEREPSILARWEEMNLYKRLREQSAGREKFILHDGPPYANGNLHIGHALNKNPQRRDQQIPANALEKTQIMFQDGIATACLSNGRSRNPTASRARTKTLCLCWNSGKNAGNSHSIGLVFSQKNSSASASSATGMILISQ